MQIDLKKFERTTPYASELYGVYQPMLGWISESIRSRIDDGERAVRSRYLDRLLPAFRAKYDYKPTGDPREAEFAIHLAVPAASTRGPINGALNSVIGTRVQTMIQQQGQDDPAAWNEFTAPDFLQGLLGQIRDDVLTEYWARAQQSGRVMVDVRGGGDQLLTSILARESQVAGLLAYLHTSGTPESVMSLLQTKLAGPAISELSWLFEQLDPAVSDLAHAVVAPIGLVHLFRQYFFEFDSFLGPPVQHVWLSPGGTVELVEVSTRKTLIEQTVEQSMQTTQSAETTTTNQDELSDAVTQENSSDTKLGVSTSASLGYNAAFISASGNISASLNLDSNQKQAREQTHKNMRQQTEKLSSEIRKSYKSTFRTVTETIDVTSKRYVLQNTTDHLVNYELRRKMRQVGVQVQDYGTQLCWQTFIDEPGDELGVSLLVHVAQPADLSNLKEPDKPPQPDPMISAQPLTVNVSWPDDDDNTYYGFVVRGQPIKVVAPKPGYIYAGAQVTRVSGEDMGWGIRPANPGDTTIDFSDGTRTLGPPDVDQIDVGDGKNTETSINTLWLGFQTAPGGYSWDNSWDASLQVTLYFHPAQAALKAVNDDYNARMKDYSDAKSRVLQETLFKEAADRVRAASNVRPRPFDHLRDEERTVVYRCLIRQLLAVAGVKNEDPRIRHVFSELVESLFDVEKMLYFVAPEWWMPRPQPSSHTSPQDVGLTGADRDTFNALDVVSWGGAKAVRPDNYYVTEDSVPAKLGSSLGWVLQLDGDNLRNAFLNAPWVKAVVPIREARELRAIEWLSSDSVEGSNGLNALYVTDSNDERNQIVAILKAHAWDDPGLDAYYQALQAADITILDALRCLILRIQAQQEAAAVVVKDPADQTIGYLPTDMVYEHGFDPLVGGFKAVTQQPFEIFDQWIEVLPTDQIVPVEVTYDPKTGMQA